MTTATANTMEATTETTQATAQRGQPYKVLGQEIGTIVGQAPATLWVSYAGPQEFKRMCELFDEKYGAK